MLSAVQTPTQGGRRRTGPSCGRDVQTGTAVGERGEGRHLYARNKYRTMEGVSVVDRNPAAVFWDEMLESMRARKGREP